MKTKINAIIVVEGRTDIVFLESFIDAEFVLTNGSSVPRETIQYLTSLSKIKKIIVLTDPDSPGKRIRDILDARIPGLYHAHINKKDAIKKNKVGVAECDQEHVLEALKNLVFTAPENGTLTMQDLYRFGLLGQSNSHRKRQILGEKLHLGSANGKTMLKRLNSVSVSGAQIEEILKEK